MLKLFFNKTKPESYLREIPGGILGVTDTKNGKILYFKNDNTIGRSINDYGEWAENEISFLNNFIKPGNLVVDIGANIGTHTIAFSKMVGYSGKVISFEPQRVVFQVLNSNLALSSSLNVYTNCCALSSSPSFLQEREINYSSPEQNFGAVYFREHKADEFSYKSIQVKKLDDFCLDKCSFIKIDAEGMEEKVLQGSLEVIKQHRPIIYLEAAGWEWVQNINSFFADKSYSLYLHYVDAYNPKNYKNNNNNIFGNAQERNIVAIPNERVVEYNFIVKNLQTFTKENFK